MSTHLLTGFPGFIGRRLVAQLLETDPELRIVAVVEERMLRVAEAAATEVGAERIELVAGDISAPRLGLEPATYERLAAEVTVVEHLAAIYDLAVPLEIAQKVNVDGTGNVLDFCEACDDLERLNYVSTAYVAGDRTGVVYEHELALGQGFKNHYESTKFQAEVWVRERMDRVPATIYRPAIVVGDSRTGETQKFDGPYYVLRFIDASKRRHMPIPNIGRGAVPFNVVPVDFIVDSLVALARDPRAAGETVHLCDPESAQRPRHVRPALPPARGAGSRLHGPGRPGGGRAALEGDQPLLRRCSQGDGPLPQPPGPLRHAQGDRAARRRRPHLPGLRLLRPGDGLLLRRPQRGRGAAR